MKTLKIFKNRVVLNKDKTVTVLHQDDMDVYKSWFLISDKMVDSVSFRGNASDITNELLQVIGISREAFSESLDKIGNPSKIIITNSKAGSNLN